MSPAIRTFVRSDGLRRARIFQRDDGLFSFDEAFLGRDWNGEPRWVALPSYSSFCETAEIAEREARAAISWLTTT
jgi:hypothetical protein